MAYLSMMIVVWNVMNNLAEIVTYLPMNGITIPYFIKRFVDPSLAFAAGKWNRDVGEVASLTCKRLELLVRIRYSHRR
jgi:amino acid permease